jgi:hypothetical protein
MVAVVIVVLLATLQSAFLSHGTSTLRVLLNIFTCELQLPLPVMTIVVAVLVAVFAVIVKVLTVHSRILPAATDVDHVPPVPGEHS